MNEDGIFALGFFGIVLFIIIFVLILGLLTYFVSAFPLYKLAKNAGLNYPWLAFIPIAQTYVLFMLPHKPFSMFKSKFFMEKRDTAFAIYILMTLAGPTIIGGIAAIPFLGTIISPVLSLALTVLLIIAKFYIYNDLYETYLNGNSNIILFDILSILFPIVGIIMFWVIMNKEPNYDNYSDI